MTVAGLQRRDAAATVQTVTSETESPDGAVDVTLAPTFDRYDITDMKVLKMEVHQCFGTWSGRIVGDDGVPTTISGVRGFAAEARNRW